MITILAKYIMANTPFFYYSVNISSIIFFFKNKLLFCANFQKTLSKNYNNAL